MEMIIEYDFTTHYYELLNPSQSSLSFIFLTSSQLYLIISNQRKYSLVGASNFLLSQVFCIWIRSQDNNDDSFLFEFESLQIITD